MIPLRTRWSERNCDQVMESFFSGKQTAGAALSTMPIKLAVPLLRVAEVARSIEWYRTFLGFVGDPFPERPPYEFAILRQGPVELMLRRGTPPVRPNHKPYDWDVYLRREGSQFREVFAAFNARGIVTRRLERMFYGLAEFEITDPDGNVICRPRGAGAVGGVQAAQTTRDNCDGSEQLGASRGG